MANSHSGTSTRNTSGGQYQVFLSFCGPDTRRRFANTVCHALLNAGIRVFIDKEDLEQGGRIGDNLMQAIDDSKICVPIFSTNYASHHWCLRELARMVENTRKSKEAGVEKVILPIFYEVSVEDVNLKTRVYTDAILKLEQMTMGQSKKFDSEEIESWRQALKYICGSSGFQLKNYTGDGHLSDAVVEEVVRKLQTRQRKVTKYLVGMKDRIADINNLLDMESGDVRLIGICGMSGMGKTTFAKVIFNQLCPRFGKNCSFLDDVKETAKTKGLIELQKQLWSDISNSKGACSFVSTDVGIQAIEETICNKKVLIVLDDVDHITQIQNLIEVNSLYSGSRILVTTRNKDVLKIEGFKFEEYEMVGLSDEDALQLFSRHAFKVNSPPPDYFTLSKDIVSTVGGLPLALEAIGASLFGPKKREIWEEMRNDLRKIPDDNVLGKLQITYDALKPGQQQIFLDIACLFIGSDKTNPIYMWKDCEFGPVHGAIDVLINRCMIKVLDNNKFWMHDQFRDLGRAISNRERSRLWASDDINHELSDTEINRSVQALVQYNWSSNNHTTVTPEKIKRFPRLRLLWLHDEKCQGDFTGCLSELRWIDLSYGSPGDYTATNLNLEKVVVMEISGCGWREDAVISLVEGAKKLKALTLAEIRSLHRTPTFSKDVVLEKLTFHRCKYLEEIDCSIGKLRYLTDLTIEDNKALQKLPEQIGELKHLQHLSLSCCWKLRELPDSVSKLKSLTKLDVSHTSITRLPDSIGTLQSLSSLDLSHTQIVKLPETISNLSQLHTLDLCISDIQELPKLPESLTTLRLISSSLQTVPDLSNLTNLVELLLSDSSYIYKESVIIQPCDLPWIGGGLSKLRELHLCLLNVHATSTDWASLTLLEELTLERLDLQTLKQLPSNLRVLRLSNTQVEQVELDRLPQLKSLTIESCKLITRISIPSSLRELRVVEMSCCNKLVEVQFHGVLESMEKLYISGCESLERLVFLSEEAGCNELQATEFTDGSRRGSLVSSSLKTLRQLWLMECPVLQEIQFVSAWESLKKFVVRECISLNVPATSTDWASLTLLEELTLCGLDLQTLKQLPSNLRVLRLNNTRVKQVELDGLAQLKRLSIESCELITRISIPSSLRELRVVEVIHCNKLVEVQFLGVLESMVILSIGQCKSLGRLVCLSEEAGCNEVQAPELSDGLRSLSLVSSSPKTLQELQLSKCPDLQEIQFVSALDSLERFVVRECVSLKRLGGLSNLKNLKGLHISECKSLQVVEGIDELEHLEELTVENCISMGKIIDASSSKVPKECEISFIGCGEESYIGLYGGWINLECYREEILKAPTQASDSDIETTSSELETVTGETLSEEQDDGDKDDNNGEEDNSWEDDDDEDNEDDSKDDDDDDDSVHEDLENDDSEDDEVDDVPSSVCSMDDNDLNNDVDEEGEGEADGYSDSKEDEDEYKNVHEVLQSYDRPLPVSSVGDNDENNDVTEEGKRQR